MKSTDFLAAAAAVQEERGNTYDQPGGERSAGRVAAAFNAITGKDLTPAEAWLILQITKDVRQWSALGYHRDSALDCVSYASLKAEALAEEGQDRPGESQIPDPHPCINGVPGLCRCEPGECRAYGVAL